MLPLKWRQTFWCVLVRQICVCRVTICWWSQFMSETSLLLLSGIVWASRMDDVRWAFLRHHGLMKSGVCFWGIIVVCDPSDVCFWGGSFLMKSDVCVWNFIGSPLIKSDVCFWNFIIGSLLIKSDVCVWNFIIGTGITACLSQLFGTWVHWWRRVLVLWRCRKNRKNLDWIFLLDVSLLLRLAYGRISIVEYVRWCRLGSDLLAVWLLR